MLVLWLYETSRSPEESSGGVKIPGRATLDSRYSSSTSGGNTDVFIAYVQNLVCWVENHEVLDSVASN